MSQQEEKSGVQKLRERYYSIKNNLKPSKELIDALIKSGKLKLLRVSLRSNYEYCSPL